MARLSSFSIWAKLRLPTQAAFFLVEEHEDDVAASRRDAGHLLGDRQHRGHARAVVIRARGGAHRVVVGADDHGVRRWLGTGQDGVDVLAVGAVRLALSVQAEALQDGDEISARFLLVLDREPVRELHARANLGLARERGDDLALECRRVGGTGLKPRVNRLCAAGHRQQRQQAAGGCPPAEAPAGTQGSEDHDLQRILQRLHRFLDELDVDRDLDVVGASMGRSYPRRWSPRRRYQRGAVVTSLDGVGLLAACVAAGTPRAARRQPAGQRRSTCGGSCRQSIRPPDRTGGNRAPGPDSRWRSPCWRAGRRGHSPVQAQEFRSLPRIERVDREVGFADETAEPPALPKADSSKRHRTSLRRLLGTGTPRTRRPSTP